ncbi:MAG: hypothetical protein DMG03_20245, partial [Acidobacteria bacterium]
RDLWVLVRRASPARVSIGGVEIPRVSPAELGTQTRSAWALDEGGVVTVRLRDDFTATDVTVEGAEAR